MQPLQHLSCTHVYKHLSPSLAAQLGTTHALCSEAFSPFPFTTRVHAGGNDTAQIWRRAHLVAPPA
jgi:hypothetical protein